MNQVGRRTCSRLVVVSGGFLDARGPRYDRPMSNYVFSSAVRSSIRSELRAYVRRTRAVYVDLIDENDEAHEVVASAGELLDAPTDAQAAGLPSFMFGVRKELWLSAWIPATSSIEVARRELKDCAVRLQPVAGRAALERRIWRALAASWRCDDVGPRSDVRFTELRLVPWHRLTGLTPLAAEPSL